MVVWSVWLALVVVSAVSAIPAIPDPPTVGSTKFSTVADCAGPVAFSAIQGAPTDTRLIFSETLVNKGVGYVDKTGLFTTHCPGLYLFSFAGYGDGLRLTLKKKVTQSESWIPLISTGTGGGSNLILQEVDAGDQLAVFVESGTISQGASFSGYRVAKN